MTLSLRVLIDLSRRDEETALCRLCDARRAHQDALAALADAETARASAGRRLDSHRASDAAPEGRTVQAVLFGAAWEARLARAHEGLAAAVARKKRSLADATSEEAAAAAAFRRVRAAREAFVRLHQTRAAAAHLAAELRAEADAPVRSWTGRSGGC